MLDKLWRQVFVTRMVSAQGGYSSASQPVVSKELLCDGRQVSFLKVNKNSLWLLKLCGGKSARKGLLRRTRVIEQLRGLCESNDPTTGMDDTPTKSAVADRDDPMQQLEHIGETTVVPFPCKKRMRKGYTDVVLRVSIAETFGATQLRDVRVLRSQKNSLCSHEEDVPWLVAYVA